MRWLGRPSGSTEHTDIAVVSGSPAAFALRIQASNCAKGSSAKSSRRRVFPTQEMACIQVRIPNMSLS